MDEQRLVNLLSQVLGPGTKKGANHYNFKCPACQHHNHKLAIQVIPEPDGTHPWQCLHCRVIKKTGGKNIMSLLKRFNFPQSVRQDIYALLEIKPTKVAIREGVENIQLPEEFKALYKYEPQTPYETKRYDEALTYLIHERQLTVYDILKYNIGFCLSGPYSSRLVFPSYNTDNQLNYFTTRSFTGKHKQNYKNPDNDKTRIVPYENLINWDEPVILVEGVFDMFSVKRNALPLLGKTLNDTVLKKIINSNTQKVYVCLDKDAINNALVQCERLMQLGKEVYFVELSGKDPNKLGFETITNILQNTYPLSYNELVKLKIRNI